MITETKAKSEIREPDEWDAMLRAMMDEEVRRGNFVTVGINANGEMAYRITAQGRRAVRSRKGADA